jgi:hypothetical protein
MIWLTFALVATGVVVVFADYSRGMRESHCGKAFDDDRELGTISQI